VLTGCVVVGVVEGHQVFVGKVCSVTGLLVAPPFQIYF